jgi:hypothetical protein
MALRGNLRDFSLPDVFQLVQLSGKTGVLRIQGPEADGSIWFRDGEVFFAQSNWRREQLGERLVAAQRITPAALARALELRASEPEGGRRLGEILVNEGYITPQVLETFVQEQIQDTIFDLMRWDEGDFDFEVLPDVVHEDIGLSVSVENIVMEGSRRLEEWQRIKKKVPSTDMVFKMATAPGEGTFEISLKPIEWALLLLIDGTRSVRELAVETRSTDFDVARVIYGLFSAGLLEVPLDDEIERLRADRARREDKRARLEANRAARDEQQTGEALDLEAQLAAQAEARMQAEVVVVPEAPAIEVPAETPVPEPVVPAEVPAEANEPRHVPEEPEFLAAPGEAPSADDMAMFEQMMASVLTPQAGAVAPAPVPEPSIETPEFPSDEVVLGTLEAPAADLAQQLPDLGLVPGLDFVPDEAPAAPSFEAGEEAETPFVPYAPSLEPEAAPEAEIAPAAEDVDLTGLTIAEIEAMSGVPAAPSAAPVTGDYETDLRSLGLGEYPEELLQAQQPPQVEEQQMAAEAEPPAETRLPMSEIEAGRTEDGDLDSLLASLGGDSGPQGVIASETDFGQQEQSEDGYISTDAFLAEFDDSSLSGGLGDELTALTGGATATRARPVATVNHIPQPGEGQMLHRDQMVDKELLQKIIEGIENL